MKKYPLRISLLLPLLIGICPSAVSKVWNSQELAVGEWQVDLRGGWFLDTSRIFPRSSADSADEGVHLHRRPWGSRLECFLSLCEDGTFVLSPLTSKRSSHEEAGNDMPSKRLPLRGQWNVLANPYCITDRHYDQLRLKSYPRVAMAGGTHELQRGPCPSGSLDLTCRMSGKFAKSEAVGRKGRMTHGTLVWKEDTPQWRRPRRVLASFSAKRSAHEPQHEGWEDQNFFGY